MIIAIKLKSYQGISSESRLDFLNYSSLLTNNVVSILYPTHPILQHIRASFARFQQSGLHIGNIESRRVRKSSDWPRVLCRQWDNRRHATIRPIKDVLPFPLRFLCEFLGKDLSQLWPGIHI